MHALCAGQLYAGKDDELSGSDPGVGLDLTDKRCVVVISDRYDIQPGVYRRTHPVVGGGIRILEVMRCRSVEM
jgi:hypothetical protein